MNLDDDDDSVFERALRADLPSLSEQNRLRQRIVAAGIAAGTVIGTTSVAAAQPSLAASALSRLGALSWPAKLGLTAALAAPVTVAALPLVYPPIAGAALVGQVRTSAASVRARSLTKAARSPAIALPLEAPQAADVEPAPALTLTLPSLQSNSLAHPSALPRAPAPAVAIPTAIGSTSAAQPAVAAFDPVALAAPASATDQLRDASTLAAETQLLDRAFAALSVGDRQTATALVIEHARRFPNGLLRQERERARARLAQDPKGE